MGKVKIFNIYDCNFNLSILPEKGEHFFFTLLGGRKTKSNYEKKRKNMNCLNYSNLKNKKSKQIIKNKNKLLGWGSLH